MTATAGTCESRRAAPKQSSKEMPRAMAVSICKGAEACGGCACMRAWKYECVCVRVSAWRACECDVGATACVQLYGCLLAWLVSEHVSERARKASL